MGVRTHLTKKVAVEIIGPDGIETEEITKRDIFRKDDDFNTIVEASDAEENSSATEQRNRLGFLAQNVMNPVQNQKKAYELGAKVAGFGDDEGQGAFDTLEFGDAVMMSEAAKDIEDILDGKQLKPNRGANTAYKQRFVDYMNDHERDMTHEEFMALATYIQSCEPYVMKNMVRALNAAQANIVTPPPPGTPPTPPPGAPPAPPPNGTVPLPATPAPNGTGI